jgi:hypothetical protein
MKLLLLLEQMSLEVVSVGLTAAYITMYMAVRLSCNTLNYMISAHFSRRSGDFLHIKDVMQAVA